MSALRPLFASAPTVLSSAFVLRIGLLVYGHYQDQWSAVKYTDIDYYVFTDAARNVAWGRSPYLRDTYRYTPLLAWALVPTSWGGAWFDFGKAVFAFSDIIAGWLIYRILRSSHGMQPGRAMMYASIWLLNPMVAQISTRGSSEGLLIVMIMALLWTSLQRRYMLSGAILGMAVHFKIYPFIYAASIFWSFDPQEHKENPESRQIPTGITALVTPSRVKLTLSSAFTFMFLNAVMYIMYAAHSINHPPDKLTSWTAMGTNSQCTRISTMSYDRITDTISRPTTCFSI